MASKITRTCLVNILCKGIYLDLKQLLYSNLHNDVDVIMGFPIAIITSLKTKIHSNRSIWPLVGSLWNWASMPWDIILHSMLTIFRKRNSLYFPGCTILLPQGECTNCLSWISIRFSSMSVILPSHILIHNFLLSSLSNKPGSFNCISAQLYYFLYMAYELI